MFKKTTFLSFQDEITVKILTMTATEKNLASMDISMFNQAK